MGNQHNTAHHDLLPLFIYSALRETMVANLAQEENVQPPPAMEENFLLEFCDIAGVYNNLTRSVHAYQMRLREKIDIANRDLHEANERLKARASELEEKTSEVQKALALVERMATTDSLTGLFNRRAFEQFFDHEISKHQRYKHPGTLALIDLDYFKEVNDNYGHAAGDRVLVEFSGIVRAVLRESDIFARLGGDEFAIILPETSMGNAKIAIRKIMQAVATHRFAFEGQPLKVGLSIGIADFEPTFRSSRIMSNADAATYHSKRNGRNRASFYIHDESDADDSAHFEILCHEIQP